MRRWGGKDGGIEKCREAELETQQRKREEPVAGRGPQGGVQQPGACADSASGSPVVLIAEIKKG